jgi:tyrosine-specific transport protein
MNQSSLTTGKRIGGALIVSGTTIGAGMLATPLVTAAGGFIPATALYLMCWVTMVGMGLIMLEVHLWVGRSSNLISMSRSLLGPLGMWATSLLYIFLFYSLCVAYVSAGAGLLSWIYPKLNLTLGALIFTAIFSPFLLSGIAASDRLNRFLMLILVSSYGILVALGLPKVQFALLERSIWSASIYALPVLFTAFSFQGTVPSLCDYLGGDVKATRCAIVFGTLLTLIVYLLWQLVVLGIVPVEGSNGLLEALHSGKTAIWALQHNLERSALTWSAELFAFAAITTSYIGVNIGLIDFVSDGLKLPKRGKSLISIAGAVFVPPLVLAWIYPNIFIKALNFAGGIGCLLLLGVLPLIMLVAGRRSGRFKPQGALFKKPFLEITVAVILAFVAFSQVFVGL